MSDGIWSVSGAGAAGAGAGAGVEEPFRLGFTKRRMNMPTTRRSKRRRTLRFVVRRWYVVAFSRELAS